MRVSIVACALIALSLIAACVNGQSCLDENGKAVDWWMIVKIARLKSSSDSGVAAGTAYLYGDANSYQSPSSFWSSSSHQVSDADSSVGLTLQQIYDKASSTSQGYTMYNDELPGGATSMTYGHTKGMLAWNSKGGYWLIHSVPKFADSPANVQKYVYPSTGMEYGQSMLCMSLDVANIDIAFGQLQYNNPQVYGSQFVAALSSQMPNTYAFLQQNTVISGSASQVANLTTRGGVEFTHFAKTADWGKSIYGDLIGPYFGQELIVESWQRPYEEPLLPPKVQEPVYSVKTLAAPSYANWDGVTWKESEEHAKWAYGTDPNVPLFCVGDINKQLTQWKRSGGMACIVDDTIYSAFTGLVTTTDQDSK